MALFIWYVIESCCEKVRINFKFCYYIYYHHFFTMQDFFVIASHITNLKNYINKTRNRHLKKRHFKSFVWPILMIKSVHITKQPEFEISIDFLLKIEKSKTSFTILFYLTLANLTHKLLLYCLITLQFPLLFYFIFKGFLCSQLHMFLSLSLSSSFFTPH